MNRSTRVLINVLTPPLFAVVIILCCGIVYVLAIEGYTTSGSIIEGFASILLMMLLFSYCIAILPSIAHAAFMEWIYCRYAAQTWSAVRFSALSGLVCGIIITSVFLTDSTRAITEPSVLIFPTLGLIVGFGSGTLIRFYSLRPIPPQRTHGGCV